MSETATFRVPDPIVAVLRTASDAECAEISRWLLDHYGAGLDQGFKLATAMKNASAPLSRADRLARRDDAIRDALASYYPGATATDAARQLAVDWARYAAVCWPRERDVADLPAFDPKRRALHALTKLNDGFPLGARQIVNIASGFRGR